MTAGDAARLVGARVEGNEDAMLTGAEVDSRRIEPGDLFVALPGERADGHDFVEQALEVASAALVRRDAALADPPAGRALLRVENPAVAYEALAAHDRRRRDWKVVALTGSVGKTTTKELLARLVGACHRTGASEGNRNSTLGLPAQILSQPEDVKLFVAEMGMNHPGELGHLAALVEPDVLLYTRIAPVHMEFFSDLAAVAEAKAEALAHVRPGGVLVLNADDPWQGVFASRRADLRLVRYGAAGDEVRLLSLESRGLEGSRLVVQAGSATVEIDFRLAGRHQAENLLAAIAAAWAVGVALSVAAEVGPSLEAAPRRGRVYRLTNGVTLVDDSYNASPSAVAAMLKLLKESHGRRVAVLGEMLEMGETAMEVHREAGVHAASAADLLVAVGAAPAAALADAARDGGMKAGTVHLVDDADAALELIRELLEPGDVVLVKASRGIGLDRVVDGLRKQEEAA